ncbi:hypothetical protein G3H79_08495 [Streptomyces aureoverticillatus]|nr:hypothetical protein G3H79_08495 [Streptomyces aureoverticillatus]
MKRRLDNAPDRRRCLSGNTCPGIYELHSGKFAVVGTDRTKELRHLLACGEDQCIVVLPRHTLVWAKANIPDA